ncbi:MAG: hypothetical protein ACI9VS_001748 [Candidatus Binatia bacterium]|jgi:hypothetical protein
MRANRPWETHPWPLRGGEPDWREGCLIGSSPPGSCALPISFRIGRLRIPTGFRPKAQGWEARPTLGTTFKKHFQRRRCCANHRRFGRNPVGVVSKRGLGTQGRPAAVAEGQPWAGGRNPVGIKGNEAAPQIANLWVMHSSWEGQGWVLLRCQYRIPKSDLRPCVCEPLKASCRQAVSTHPRGSK